MKFLAVLLISATALAQNPDLGPNLKLYEQVTVRTAPISTVISGVPFESSKVVLLNTGNAKALCIVTVDGTNKTVSVSSGGHATLVFAGKGFDKDRDTFLCATGK